MSVSNEDIESALVRLGCVFRSPLLMEKIRNRDGKLTRFHTGRRFVFINRPVVPLDKFVKVGSFTARLFHKEQPRGSRSPVCTNCLQPGHQHFQCQNLITCRVCMQSGHRSGDPSCGMITDTLDTGALLGDSAGNGEQGQTVDIDGLQSENNTEAGKEVTLFEEEDDTESVFEDTVNELVPETQLENSTPSQVPKNSRHYGSRRGRHLSADTGKRHRSSSDGDSPSQPWCKRSAAKMPALSRPSPEPAVIRRENDSEGGGG